MTGTTNPSTTRVGIARTAAITTIAAAVAAAALAGGAVASSEQPSPPTWNALEHEARRSLAEAQQQQERVLNPREHEGHRPASEAGPAGRAPIADTCADALAQAWEDLGHFSDGLETWMISTPVCSTP
jgi:hypothetical protein